MDSICLPKRDEMPGILLREVLEFVVLAKSLKTNIVYFSSSLFCMMVYVEQASLVAQTVESTCNVGDPGLIPESGKIPCRRKWPPTPVFLPRKSHGQSRLVGHSLWDHNESAATKQLTLSLSLLGTK